MKYYLINNAIIKVSSEMPKEPIAGETENFASKLLDYKFYYEMWLKCHQRCEISESELDKIITYLEENVHNLKDFPALSNWETYMKNPIEVTDIVEAHQADGLFEVITFKQPKAEANDAVELRDEILKAFGWVSSIGEQFFDNKWSNEDLVDAYLKQRK